MNLRSCAASAAIALACLAGAATARPSRPPSAATPEAADEVIVVTNNTNSVDVYAGETVLFKVGAKQFAVKFGAANTYYDLSTLAPPGVLTRKVKVDVAPNPKAHGQ